MNAATAHAVFLEQRRAYIGGTDIAAIVGVSNWASPLSVYLDKTAPEKTEDSDSLPMRRGLALERFIADEFERAKPGTVTYHPAPIVRTDWGFPAGASVDRYIATTEHPRTPTAVLECKTAFSYPAGLQWKAPDPGKGLEEGDLPDSYYVQCQWYLAVTGLTWCYGAADTGKAELTIVPIHANEAVQARLIEAGLAFWTNHVAANVPPDPIGTDADAEALGRMWPETVPDPPATIEDELAEVIVSDYLAHSFKAKEHKDAAELAKQRLEALMGEHEQAMVGRWLLRWKTITSNRIDSKRLKAEKPEVAAEYTKPSTSRRFDTPKEIT